MLTLMSHNSNFDKHITCYPINKAKELFKLNSWRQDISVEDDILNVVYLCRLVFL